jgi:hypothetical protein
MHFIVFVILALYENRIKGSRDQTVKDLKSVSEIFSSITVGE